MFYKDAREGPKAYFILLKGIEMIAVGIDISKRKFDIAVIRDNKVINKVFENTAEGHNALLQWLSKKGIPLDQVHLCMEATSTYYESLAQSVYDAGCRVSVINPLQIKAFGQAQLDRQKTDRADALRIAQYCAGHHPPAWQPPAPEIRQLQRLLARLEAVVHMQVQEKNRLHEAQGVIAESIQRVLEELNMEQKKLEAQIRQHIDHHPDLRKKQELLETIDGVGNKLSAYFLAWVPLDRLTSVREAVAFIGLSPAQRESGSSVRGKARTCKLGHARMRKMLYMPAMSAMRCNEAAAQLAARLKQASKPGKSIIVAVMRKLVHWMFAVLKSAKPFDVKLALAK